MRRSLPSSAVLCSSLVPARISVCPLPSGSSPPPPSPVEMYSSPSGPKCRSPPLWLARELCSILSTSTRAGDAASGFAERRHCVDADVTARVGRVRVQTARRRVIGRERHRQQPALAVGRELRRRNREKRRAERRTVSDHANRPAALDDEQPRRVARWRPPRRSARRTWRPARASRRARRRAGRAAGRVPRASVACSAACQGRAQASTASRAGSNLSARCSATSRS